ncbi:PAS domain S-box protein [Tsuneonella sp. YG55]|uniref:histidine kinase n=1 Tax=Tsuneonella litorea TaxID=2976475 RepID=A0A9X2W3S6_9SPHN|nr:PAS domain S-box protein [Tsuneonella litorea]MCT2559704.1 PAS domain S-box protein [Tsuneonella litorea]
MTTQRLGEIVEKAAAEVFIFGQNDFRFLLVNQGARENLGYSREELSRLHPWDLKPEFAEDQFRAFVAPLIKGEVKQLHFETIHQRKDGSTYDVSVRLQLISTGDLPVFYAAIQDITEQRQIRRALEEVSGRLDAILNNTTMAVFMMDERQHCSFMNRAAEELTGYTFAETQGKPLHDVVHHTYPDGRPFPIEECAIDRAFPENSQTQGEEVFVHKDGHFYNVGFTASPMKNAEGVTVGTVIEAHNIDEELKAREALDSFNAALRRRVEEAIEERKALEAQLVQAQKMEAIGQLTGGVAHDFNNLLQVIAGNLQLIKQDPLLDGRSLGRINNALSGVERGAKLAAQLLAFGRQQPLKPKPINAGRILRDMDDMFRRTLGETVEIETIVAAGLWNCLVDPRQLENVLLNLAINARDAMKGEGKLTLEAGNASLDEDYVASHPGASTGQYVMLAVTDTGCGIPEENLAKVFEPFFTTKAPGEGTGLGLSMVFGFVKQSGGHITIYSEEGEGTTVRIYLPRTRKAEMASRPQGGWAAEKGNDEVILVVEDDTDVRSTAVELLTNLGYKVIEASDADSALAILQCGMPIDLLFTDVVMPGKLRSPELARLAKERIPDIGVLFTSGYTQNAIVHAGKLDDDIELISKPYSVEKLSRKIKQVLSNRSGKAASEPAAAPDADARHGRDTKALRVLVIEDEPLIRMSMVASIEALGCLTREASTLKEAAALLEENVFDAVISDLKLPDGNATPFLADMRARYPDMTLVIASGGSVPEELQAQAVSVLAKPFSDSELEDALRLEQQA